MRICRECKEPKLLEMFHKDKQNPSGLRTICKSCASTYNKRACKNPKYEKQARNRHLKRKYNISEQDYIALLSNQKGVCAICNKAETSTTSKTKPVSRLAVDHCHVTGRVRGLLCRHCNTAIGLFRESGHVLNQAIQYLERTSQ